MSRSGYRECNDDGEDNAYNLYRGTIARATRGKRGQRMFHDLIAALEGMAPGSRRLYGGVIDAGGEHVCALGAVARYRGVSSELAGIDPEEECAHDIAKPLDIAHQLASEVMWHNDDLEHASPEARWRMILEWARSEYSGTFAWDLAPSNTSECVLEDDGGDCSPDMARARWHHHWLGPTGEPLTGRCLETGVDQLETLLPDLPERP